MAEAYRLFEIGKSPIQVAIELKLREPLVSKLYKDYLNLAGLTRIVLLCNKIGDYAWDYLKLYELARRDGISNEKVVWAAGAIQELPYAEQRLQKLIREADNLEEKKKQLLDDVNFFESRRSKLREEIFRLAENICRKEEKIGQLRQEEEGIERIMLKHQKVIPVQRQRAVEGVAFEGGEVRPMNEGDIV
jgi:predicted nuclease with TOPRIM domain